MTLPMENENLDHSQLIRLPPDSIRVEDPNEEIFLLYTDLRAGEVQDGSTPFTGLGSVNSKADVLIVSFNLPLHEPPPPPPVPTNDNSPPHRKRRPPRKKSVQVEQETFEVELIQDKTILRSRKGDTGSVLWRITRELCGRLILQLCTKPETGDTLFDLDMFKKSHILEIGAGTGLMALVLSHWTKYYTATDLNHLVPLIQKNIAHNYSYVTEALSHHLKDPRKGRTSTGRISVEALDWLDIHNSPLSSRLRLFPPELPGVGIADIIFAVDCVYNSSLLPPLVTVLNHYAATDRTRVVVAVELRSEDVLREFLELWIGSGKSSSDNSDEYHWVIHRICGDAWMDPCFAVWVGWKSGAGAHAEADFSNH